MVEAAASAEAAIQLIASIREISGSASQATAAAADAVHKVGAARETVAGLGTSSGEIGSVVQGFAVVAGEVKDLAQQTRTATEDVSTRIGSIQSDTTRAITSIGSIADAVHEVSRVNTVIAETLARQSSMTDEFLRRTSLTVHR